LGGLLMGMGAMYSACNLGGFFDGTASGSLHGWVWMLMALAGSLIGIRLRPLFKL
ncbi:YeeE/YedE thiosulfate transporter family protein, partial [Aeromonas salmonicida]